MSYEFSDRSQALNLPNPYRIENLFLYFAAAALLVAGLVVLFQVRGHLSAAGAGSCRRGFFASERIAFKLAASSASASSA